MSKISLCYMQCLGNMLCIPHQHGFAIKAVLLYHILLYHIIPHLFNTLPLRISGQLSLYLLPLSSSQSCEWSPSELQPSVDLNLFQCIVHLYATSVSEVIFGINKYFKTGTGKETFTLAPLKVFSITLTVKT